MAQITAQQITQAGIKPTTVTPASGGDKLKNTAKEFFWVQNTSSGHIKKRKCSVKFSCRRDWLFRAI